MNNPYSYDVAELNRRLNGMVRFCKVVELGTEDQVGRVKVSDGALTSTWLIQGLPRAADNNTWQPLDVDEYVVVLCPSGDFSQGVIIGSLYQSAFPAPEHNPDITLQTFKDGTKCSYDRDEHHLHITIAKEGTIHIEVVGGATIDGPVTINGDVKINGNTAIVGDTTVDGSVSAAREVTAADVNLTKHVHSGVAPGDKKTLKPE